MNDEIKELIEELKDSYGIAMPKQEYFSYIKGIEDYITNLQQELEEYKDTETYSKRFLYKANKDRLNANLELVKENERLKEHKEYYKNETKRLGKLFYITKEENIKLEEAQKNFEKQFIKEMDYKSRCEKAVEYLKSKEDSLFMSFSDDMLDHDELIDKKIGTTLLQILNGDNNE